MKITEIKSQVKTAGRFSIFVDDKYAFSLSDTALLEHKLYIGQEINESKLQKLKQASGDDKALGLVLRYASLRPHSEWEIRTYMQRKKITPALADTILNKLTDLSIVDDAAFAKSWVESRRLLRPTSKRKLQQELRAKRVSNEVIDQTLSEDNANEQETLRVVIAKKRARYPDDLKLMQYLARQGFKYDDIKSALNENE